MHQKYLIRTITAVYWIIFHSFYCSNLQFIAYYQLCFTPIQLNIILCIFTKNSNLIGI